MYIARECDIIYFACECDTFSHNLFSRIPNADSDKYVQKVHIHVETRI